MKKIFIFIILAGLAFFNPNKAMAACKVNLSSGAIPTNGSSVINYSGTGSSNLGLFFVKWPDGGPISTLTNPIIHDQYYYSLGSCQGNGANCTANVGNLPPGNYYAYCQIDTCSGNPFCQAMQLGGSENCGNFASCGADDHKVLTVSDKTCTVSVSGNAITYSGRGETNYNDPVKLSLERVDGAAISPMPGTEQIDPNNMHSYVLDQCTSTNGSTCGATKSIPNLPAGNYFSHCDVFAAPSPCSGNPFCTGSCKDSFRSCSASDHQSLAVNQPACSSLYIQVSSDKNNWSDNVIVPPGATKYYVKAMDTNDHTKTCSTSFDAIGGDGVVHSPIGNYHSGNNGIARMDFLGTFPDGSYTTKYRPYGGSGTWSNPTTITINNSTLNSLPNTDWSSYFVSIPGYSWIFKNENILSGKSQADSGNTRIQVENDITTCNGITVRPWRYTKDSPYAYLDSYLPNASQLSLYPTDDWWNQSYRLFVVAPDFQYTSGPQTGFNNYRWVIGDRRYLQKGSTGNIPLRDLGNSDYGGNIFWVQNNSNTPPYEYLPLVSKSQSYLHIMNGKTSSGHFGIDVCINPPYVDTDSLASQNPLWVGSWQLRVDMDNITIDNPLFKYTGPALRTDQYEGAGTNLFTGQLLRESWYYVKNIGLVQVLVKHFNNYAQMASAKQCIDDPDCLNDTIQNPDQKVTLDNYFQNPTLDVSASTDGVNYSNTMTALPQYGYSLKINNSPYTGYLEIQLDNDAPVKWLWASNGVISTGPLNMTLGIHTAKFRVWIPDESFPNEQRVGSNNLPWSNPVTINLVNHPLTPTSSWMPGDLNHDGKVDISDYNQLVADFGKTGSPGWIASDINSDGKVDIFDYNILVGNWGKTQ